MTKTKKVTKVTGKRPPRRDREAFLRIFSKNPTQINRSCEKAGISRVTLDRWRNDPEFLEKYNMIRESIIDESENVVYKKIKKGDVKSAMFVLDRLGKHRGYGNSPLVNVETNVRLEKIEVVVLPSREVKKDD